MKFYPFNIGDYTRRTSHLTLIEDICYRRLLDLYYMTEAPIPLDLDKVSRLIGMRDHNEVVYDIVCEFFTKSDAGYLHETCEEEIAKYHSKADRARGLAEKRWSVQRDDTKSHTTSHTISDTKSCATNTNTNTKTSINKKQDDDYVVVVPEPLASATGIAKLMDKWHEYIQYRKSTRMKSLKKASVESQFSKFNEWGLEASIDSIQTTIRNGWQGIFELKTASAGRNQSTPSEFDSAF